MNLEDIKDTIDGWRANDGGLTSAACDVLWVIDQIENYIESIKERSVEQLQQEAEYAYEAIFNASTGAEMDAWICYQDSILEEIERR